MSKHSTGVAYHFRVIEYTYEHEVHSIKFLKNSREAVDEYFVLMRDLYRDVRIDQNLKFVIDYRQSGIPPIKYLLHEEVKWVNELPIHPPVKMAIIHQDDHGIKLLGELISVHPFGHLKMKFVTTAEEAYAWL